MRDKVIEYIQRYKMLDKGDGVLVSVSGGPDSMCLLHILRSIEEMYQLRLMVVHINHLLREKDADQDADYVKNICGDWGIPYFSYRIDVKKLSKEEGLSIEEAGRKARYEIFYQLKDKHNLQKIALGQHGDDNAETVIMRIIRGTGPKGLAGIPPIRKDGVIRPLLWSSKAEIEKYCEKHHLCPRIDHTNYEPIYFRNKIRLEVIPYLESFNNNLKSNLKNLAEISIEQQDYIEEQMEKLWVENARLKDGEILLPIDWFYTLSIFEKKEMLRRSIKRIKNNLNGIEYTHIQLSLNKIDDVANTTWTIQLPQGIRIERQYKELFIKKHKKNHQAPFKYPLRVGQKTFIPEINKEFNIYLEKVEDIDIIKDDDYKFYFDYNKTGKDLWLRNRRQGDRFQPHGGNGTKKLKDYFIDLKLPRENRDSVPILTGNGGIIWVVGYRPDKKYLVDRNTKEVLIVECIHEEEHNGE